MSAEPFVSYAQNGEDVVLARALAPDERTGFWIDVGAGDPVTDSVTKAFSLRGWTGINVEPSPGPLSRLREDRPHETCLSCALGRRAGFAKLYPGPGRNTDLDTLVPQIAERHYLDEQDTPEPIEVEVRTLAEIADRYAPSTVDFLKIDVEGFEAEVLAGADFDRVRPRVVVVEAVDPNEHEATHAEWEPALLDGGYEFALFDGINRFYVVADEPELVRAVGVPANVLDAFVQHRDVVELRAALDAFGEAEEYALNLEVELTKVAREYRLLSDRAEHADALVANLRDDLAAAQTRGALSMGEAARLAAYVEALEATRTFRSTRRLRAIYAILRRVSGARP
jgi:FkbM family methyltransferase